MNMSSPARDDSVLSCSDMAADVVDRLLGRYSIDVEWLAAGTPITGSFWGEPEAGIVGRQVFVRPDTPVHSLLHEVCHIICMTPERAGMRSTAMLVATIWKSLQCVTCRSYLQIICRVLAGNGLCRTWMPGDTVSDAALQSAGSSKTPTMRVRG